MSKSTIRKITVEPTKCNADSRRPSVFARLGTKPATTTASQITLEYCRNWASNGNCSYGKSCKYANTHTLISPSKRVKKDNVPANAANASAPEDPFKRLTSKIVKKVGSSHSPDLNLEEWNQTDLEYEDEKVLERRRQLLQRELELQMKKDKEVQHEEKTQPAKKRAMSSSSSHSSSSSSTSSSSSSDDSSSSSTSTSHKKINKKSKPKRHQTPSSDYEDKNKKLKLKRLGGKNDNVVAKKKRRIEPEDNSKMQSSSRAHKKVNTVLKKATPMPRAKSPVMMSQSSAKSKDRNRSDSPKLRTKDNDKERYCNKSRDFEDVSSKDAASKCKSVDRSKECDRNKGRLTDDKSKSSRHSKERRSRSPFADKNKHAKELLPSNKSRRSRTPEKLRSKKDTTPIANRHQDKHFSSNKVKEPEKKDRDSHKTEKSKERDDRKSDQSKAKTTSCSSADDGHRKFDDKNYNTAERMRQRSKERREKEIGVRDDRGHSRLSREQREKERDDERCRERQKEKERESTRDKDSKIRDRDIPPLIVSSSNSLDKSSSRYAREKERSKDGDKSADRDRRSDRDRERERERSELTKTLDRGRYDKEPHKVDRDRSERFIPRERSADRIPEKTIAPGRDLLLERDPIYDRDHHRRFGARYERGNHSSENERKEQPRAMKIERLPERRDSPRRSLEIDRNFERNYNRMDQWEPPPEEQNQHLDYRDISALDGEKRKLPENRRYGAVYPERRGRDDRSQTRYNVPGDRPFEELHHHHHPLYPAEKLRPAGARDETNAETWDIHHDMEHGNRERNYPAADWEEREWRSRQLWERENLPRPAETREEEWVARYEKPLPEWKLNDNPRKWENPALRASYNKRRQFNTLELRDEANKNYNAKQNTLLNMKNEPINKKLMELAEGRLNTRLSREKSVDAPPNKIIVIAREKSENKEPPKPVETKRVVHEENAPVVHPESDFSDISDDGDDILNMDDEEIECSKSTADSKKSVEREVQSLQNQEPGQPSPKLPVEESIFSKEKDSNSISFKNIDDDNIEAMDFEEISDGELEEDVRTSGKGLGDALGVDWESLVKDAQPRRTVNSEQSAQSRWQCKAIIQRIGISTKNAGQDFLNKFTKKYGDVPAVCLLNNIALLHTALVRKQVMMESNPLTIVNTQFRDTHPDVIMEEDESINQPYTILHEEVKALWK